MSDLIIDPGKAFSMIQECFFDFYLCPDCQTSPKEPSLPEEKKLKYSWCQCFKLRRYKSDSFYSVSYKEAMVFHVKDDLQWIAYYTYSIKDSLKFRVVEGAVRFDVQELVNKKPSLEYTKIPDFVFKPLDQMEQNIQTLITFQ